MAEGSSTPLLSAEELRRRGREGDLLLDGVSLDLGTGQRVALQGPTGSGKTLLLRSLALLDPLDGGRVLWRGEPVPASRIPSFRSQVVYLHQTPGLMEGTGAENLRRVRRLAVHAGRSFEDGEAAARLERLGLGAGLLERPRDDLSGGETQIIALLRALQIDPVALLLDEPTAALDPETREACEELLLDWWRETPQERSWIWVSHDPAQGDRIATTVWRMGRGGLENGG